MKKCISPVSGRAESGFTLIELSIVLVIIGLIVGGILTGQDMIKAAQIRATVSQLEKYSTAVNTFRSKYNGLPGDINNCTNYFTAADCATTGTTAGNGALEDVSGTRVLVSGEPVAMWHQLYLANLIADAMSDTTDINANASPAASALINILPAAKIGNGNFVLAYTGANNLVEVGMSGVNLLRIAGVTGIAAGVPTFANSLSPLEALQIDGKIDDGVPNTGVVQATDVTAGASFNVAADTYTPGNTKCVVAGPPVAYNTGTSNGAQNNRLCQLMIRPSF